MLVDRQCVHGRHLRRHRTGGHELALDYARERRQGGVPIAAHQNVAYRLFHMYRKVEAARALARRAMLYNFTQPVPALQAAMASKITGTQAAFEVASDALQIFCGAGIRRDAPSRRSSGTPAVDDRGRVQRDPGHQGRPLPGRRPWNLTS